MARVQAKSATWLARAQIETQALIAAGRFARPRGSSGRNPPSIWSEIKIVFMELQHYKCIFCERALAHREGTIEHDVEHYRPKNPVVVWAAPPAIAPIPHQPGPALNSGYYWLAYDLENYGAACKLCNSSKKRSYFPIAGARGAPVQTVAQLNAQEQPLIIFPLAENPASLITFRGILALPLQQAGPDFVRALATISLFNLNGREELWEDRFRAIRAVVQAAEVAETGRTQARRDDAITTLAELISERSPQSACANAFLQLMRTDADEAWTVYQDARAFINAG